MNDKASVSKELNDKHVKILESLLKRPENRECADCRSKGPRWASINLGIFICMQCSGIHRSLGVHISKVRSTTLDTWLPEQIFFMQSMGNEKSNGYWEEELPPNFNRSEIGRFIHAKYQEKKWASKNMIQPSEKSISSALLGVGGGTKRYIPKKTRNLSLDEESFFKIAPIDPAPFRPRGGSLDITNKVNPTPALTTEYDTSIRKANKVSDIFNTPNAEDKKQNQHPGPPARWTTFECKKLRIQ